MGKLSRETSPPREGEPMGAGRTATQGFHEGVITLPWWNSYKRFFITEQYLTVHWSVWREQERVSGGGGGGGEE